MTEAERWRGWLDLAVVEESGVELRPDYRPLIIAATSPRPGPSDAATDALLREAETAAKTALARAGSGGTGGAEDLPQIADWRLAYKGFRAEREPNRARVGALVGG